jgi:hypothetical protein
MPVDLTDPGSRTEHQSPAPARQGGGQRQSHQKDGSLSDLPSVSSSAACRQNDPPTGTHPRHQTGDPASAARTAARTSARRQPSAERWRHPAQHLATAVNSYRRPGADAHRHYSRSRGRAPPGRDPYRTVPRHCWPGVILGRHCSSEEIPSSFCKLYRLIPAPRCAPPCAQSSPQHDVSEIRRLPAGVPPGIAARRGPPGRSVAAPAATGMKCWTNRKSHPVWGGSF